MDKSDSAVCIYSPQDVICLGRQSNTENQSTDHQVQVQEQQTLLTAPTRRNASQTFLSQKYMLFEILQNASTGSNQSLNKIKNVSKDENVSKFRNREAANDNLSTILSTFYAKFIVVLGIAFPVTDILSLKAPPSFYQGFYLYLYLVSVIFVIFVYITHLKTKYMLASSIQHSYQETNNDKSTRNLEMQGEKVVVRYGSFYLRIGAVAFGIGSMVYSGLEFGQYFELKHDIRCQNLLIILNPAARMLLTIVQMQFIFLNTKDLCLRNHKIICRFGLMHMIATNLCEWLYVLVEETKHEIIHIAHKNIDEIINEHERNSSLTYHTIMKRATSLEIVVECRRTNIMGNLVQNASPFLFPCTIEYSLICAVTLFEMWKRIRGLKRNEPKLRKLSTSEKGAHHFSVDCARAHKGMFGGILIIVLSIISLVVYFELSMDIKMHEIGILGIYLSECLLFIVSTIAVLGAMYQMQDLRYSKSYQVTQSVDCNLLIVAQSGVYIYTMFSIIGSYFSLDVDAYGILGLFTEILSLIQTSIQTLFILNAWWRRCRSSQEIRKKPGREIVTFLLVANMSLWSINSLIKNRAAFRPTHLQFFGQWAWTIITHISMPLAIFYRLHSTICLFEIWKNTYKVQKQ